MIEKPTGRWRCRDCGNVCDGAEVYIDPRHQRLCCSNLFCGGTVDRVEPEQSPLLQQALKDEAKGL